MTTLGRATIGEYEAALRDINNPESSHFIAPPESWQSCDELITGINFLTNEIQFWTTKLNSLRYGFLSGDRETADNIGKILQVQNTKLQLYQQAHQIKCLSVQPVQTAAPVEPVPEVGPGTSGNGSSFIFPLLLLAGGIWLINRRRMRNRKRSTRNR